MTRRFGRPYFIAGMITTTLPLTGCGGDGSGGPVATPVTSTGQYKSLQFTLTANNSYARGQQVPLTFTIKNTGTQVVNASLGLPDAEIRQNDQVVWQYSKTTGLTEGYALIALAPGQPRTYNLTWNQTDLQGRRVAPGQYSIKVWVNSDGVDGVSIPADQQENAVASPPLSITIR